MRGERMGRGEKMHDYMREVRELTENVTQKAREHRHTDIYTERCVWGERCDTRERERERERERKMRYKRALT